MKVVGHNDVGIDAKPASGSSFIERFAGDDFDRVCSEDWQAISRYSGEIESGSVS